MVVDPELAALRARRDELPGLIAQAWNDSMLWKLEHELEAVRRHISRLEQADAT